MRSRPASLAASVVLAVFSAMPTPGWASAASSRVLGNDRIRATIAANGGLEKVEDAAASEAYAFESDAFSVDSDLGSFSNRDVAPTAVQAGPGQVEYRYEFGGGVGISLVYRLGPGDAFFRRNLTLRNDRPLRLGGITLGRTAFASPAREVLHYVTFIAAPTVEFIRHDRGGLFTGIENPFFQASLATSGVALRYEPGLILKPGEGYASEPQFLGVYRRSGAMVEDSGREFRYDANGSGYKPIDRNEMRAMRAFALDYLRPAQDRFLEINYQFFHPLPRMPRTEKDLDYFSRTIDTFSEIGGDMIIFRPLHPFRKPDAGRPFWDVLPDDPGHPARRVADRAASKGISYGFYMGCADHGGREGNPGGLAFRPDRPEWKKRDAAGRRAPDNCLACDAFFDWWLAVQDNTIRKYRLSNWSWDPSLGSGANCHDEAHGHLAGRGGYKGWRRCIELMARLKAANPGLFIQGFYGTKQFGLWGLRHVDQFEVYNEQTIIVSTRHGQISDDRQNADGLRFQNNWSMRFRFTPAVIGHALAHRIGEGHFDPELIKAWDHDGWRYGVMSALAVSGSVMPTILPYRSELVPGYVAFYRKWSRWARENFEYVNYTEPFGEQVQPGAVDGYARIKEDRGFVFLFNGNPRPAEIAFEIGDEINLQAPGRYELIELYPAETRTVVLDADGRSAFDRGERARIVVPANSCSLLELRKAGADTGPVVAGAAASVARRAGAVELVGVSGKPGRVVPARIRLADAPSVERLTVNGTPLPFRVAGGEIAFEIGFAGPRHVRELDSWRSADGRPFDFPNHPARADLRISTTFRLADDVPQLLRRATPGNAAEMGAKIAAWQTSRGEGPSGDNPYSYHNFVGARPERLWLILPFLRETAVEATLNDRRLASLMRDTPSNSLFADITDLVLWDGENRLTLALPDLRAGTFMGPFLVYPEEPGTEAVTTAPAAAEPRVVYRGPLVPSPPPRYRPGAGPVVTEASMDAHVTLTRGARLRVRVDLPPERLRRVMFFESGFPWMGQHPLQFDPARRCWTAEVKPGLRSHIQEGEFLYVWAEDVDGLRGEYVPVRVEWDFTDAAP